MRNSLPPAERPILVCAALGIEARACRAGIARAGERARLFEVLLTGMGARSARTALAARLARGDLAQPRCIISTGFAGSLVRELHPYDWILGARVGARALISEPAKRLLDEAGVPASPASVGGPSADAVDLESETLAAIADEHGIPFQLFRLISDAPSFPLPEAIERLSAGETLRALSGALRNPVGLSRYFLGAAKLPGALERGWVSGAQAFSDPELLEILWRKHSA